MQATAATEPRPSLGEEGEVLRSALISGALPGETDGLDEPALGAAITFLQRTAAEREPGKPAIRIETMQGQGARRRMRLAIVNDDMPFIVDSVAAAIAARGLATYRLLHPVLPVRRNAAGRLESWPRSDSGEAPRESVLYIEMERGDARTRQALLRDIRRVLDDVRAAVADWPALQQAMRDDVALIPEGEGAALLAWFLDQHFTFLGRVVEEEGGGSRDPLGMLRTGPEGLLSHASRKAAFAYFHDGGEAPLILKAERISTVHRRAPLDLIIVPRVADGRVSALSVHAGLWTSAALSSPPAQVPILRRRLTAIEGKFGFASTGHAGKSLRHVLSSLPHDLLVAIGADALEELALTAMSLIDRPRPKLMVVGDPLRQNLFAFVWVPREELSTARRLAIADMLVEATGGKLASWSIDLGDGDLALVRYMIHAPSVGSLPDVPRLDRAVVDMVRGWAPGLEEQLIALIGPSQARRLALIYGGAFSPGYRARYDTAEAARDVRALHALGSDEARGVRLFRLDGDAPERLHLKVYRRGEPISLSEAVPVLEHFGFGVLEEYPSVVDRGRLGHIHDFLLDSPAAATLMERREIFETAIAAVLDGRAEDDELNALLAVAELDERAIVLFRAWFRYLRQTGLAYGLTTVAQALRRAGDVAAGIVALFDAHHRPGKSSAARADDAERRIEAGLARVAAIDDDRILRRLAAVVRATLRTNAFSPAAEEALAFKLDSKGIPGLPAPVPWREIFVYSPRVEGIHLRSGPIARGGIRWSDRRDDFRTEILGLMKAQVVKNAVIVPTGAKGGFYPKRLPSPKDREAWMAEGTESYRVFIRALLSVTDNIVGDEVVHPAGVTVGDGDDPYFVVAADKGTASFSDVANAIAVDRGFWLGDAFASGGSHGYDHKAMGITARGAWISVQRHFAELGIDVQTEPVTVAGVGDMSGDVFGNGMLLSKAIRLVAAFDHRHIFLDPSPDPARSWEERARLFALPRSSWADYDPQLISTGGGVFPRDQKAISLSPEVRAMLGVEAEALDPSALMAEILKMPADLLWFGGIGTYVKGADETNAEVGDNANDAHRVNGEEVRARVIGEGANLAVTQAGRIGFASRGGRLNTDFIDNSAGVDCSDNEVNIKIALSPEVVAGRLPIEARNALLAEMTDDVATLVLEDNRLQTLALSLAETGGAAALPSQVRAIEMLEASGKLDRAVEGLGSNEELLRRAQDGQGLGRPELAVLLSSAKLALQAALEASNVPDDPGLAPLLHNSFPTAMREAFGDAIERHRLRREIIATRVANLVVNRLGFLLPLELAEEEGASLAQVAAAYLAADTLFGAQALWHDIERAELAEPARLGLLQIAIGNLRVHMADLLRVSPPGAQPGEMVRQLSHGVARLGSAVEGLLRDEARKQAGAQRATMLALGADAALADRIARLDELDGAIGTATLAGRLDIGELDATRAYVRIGEALALDWAKAAAMRVSSSDPWERLLIAGLVRDFEQMRLDFLARIGGKDPIGSVEQWLQDQAPEVAQFVQLAARARATSVPSAAMLAQVAQRARALLSHGTLANDYQSR